MRQNLPTPGHIAAAAKTRQGKALSSPPAAGGWVNFAVHTRTHSLGRRSANKEFSFADDAKGIRGIGVDRAILSSDLGQVNKIDPVDGWKLYLGGMKEQGFTDAELDRMTKENPAKLLGLTK